MKTIIASPKAPKAVGPYSQAVKCGDAPVAHQPGTYSRRGGLLACRHRENDGSAHRHRRLRGDERRLCHILYERYARTHLLSGIQAADGCEGRDRRCRRQVKRIRRKAWTEGPDFAAHKKTIIYRNDARFRVVFRACSQPSAIGVRMRESDPPSSLRSEENRTPERERISGREYRAQAQ